MHVLSPDSPVTMLGHPDGGLREVRDAIEADLRALLTDGSPVDQLVATWRGDGHRDHRIVGEVCATLADELGCTFLEYPIWLWHWATPDDPRVPWDRLRVVELADRSVVRKHRAVAAHATQVAPLSSDPRDAPTLHPAFLRTFDRDVEVVVAQEPARPTPAGRVLRRHLRPARRPLGVRRPVVRGAQARADAGGAPGPAVPGRAWRSAAGSAC